MIPTTGILEGSGYIRTVSHSGSASWLHCYQRSKSVEHAFQLWRRAGVTVCILSHFWFTHYTTRWRQVHNAQYRSNSSRNISTSV